MNLTVTGYEAADWIHLASR